MPRTWSRRGSAIGVSVNVPYRTIDDAELADGILGLLETTGMSPELLTLEVVPSGPGAGAELDRTVLERLDEAWASGSPSTTSAARRRSPRCVSSRSSEAKIDAGFVRGLGTRRRR